MLTSRKLILYLVISGLFLLFLGLGLILLYNTYEDQYHYIRPLIVIGKKIDPFLTDRVGKEVNRLVHNDCLFDMYR